MNSSDDTHSLLPCVELDSAMPAKASVLWLHGLGADGYDFEPVARMIQPRLAVPVRFVLPHAPRMRVTLNGGMPMPAWYDMLNMEHPRNVDWDTVKASEATVTALLERELARGIAPEMLFLAGFSQGGALALRLGLRPDALPKGGLLALSTYLLEDAEHPAMQAGTVKKTPIFMAHGKSDPVIPFDLAEQACERLEDAGADVHWESYSMPHAVCQEEIAHIMEWLNTRLKPFAG